jgi:acetyl-CoA carboxylase biotin carboxyl carrier protein
VVIASGAKRDSYYSGQEPGIGGSLPPILAHSSQGRGLAAYFVNAHDDKLSSDREVVQVGVKRVLSPMPGLVARVTVDEGDEVKKGDIVAVLNVMKMEINVATHENGKVREILVKEWDEMDSGTPMILLD